MICVPLFSAMSVPWTTQAKDILQKVKETPDCEAFLEPVPWKELGLDDYPVVVTYPMDVKTMSNKLKKNEYKTAEEFFFDLSKIWANCQAYNQPGSDLYLVAVRMQGETAKLREDFFAKRRKYREEVTGETLVDRLVRRIARLESENLGKVVQFVKHQAGSAISEEPAEMDDEGTLISVNLSAMDEGSLKYTNQLVKELLKNHQ